MLNGKVVLITGGTGSFGQKCTETILSRYKPRKLIIFSRDELKQFEMAQKFPVEKYESIRYFIGDVRDKERLNRAFQGVDIIIHAAALKQVPAAEYNPFEAVKTNIIGSQNVINVAADRGVKKVIALSTDKAVSPVNLYGATKLCAEKLFVAANAFVSQDNSTFSVVRYGNVIGSRGSVVPLFKKLQETGVLPITDVRMTRFWMTIGQAVEFVLNCLEKMVGGEIFVPKLPSMKITDLARAVGPACKTNIVGIRPGEKIHETLITKDEAFYVLEYDDHYMIKPAFRFFGARFCENDCTSVPEGFEYSSGSNTWWLTIEQIREMTTQK